MANKLLTWAEIEAGLVEMEKVRRIYHAEREAAVAAERERCAKLCEDSEVFEYDDPGGFFARLIRVSAPDALAGPPKA
jgi:hypothetical protein